MILYLLGAGYVILFLSICARKPWIAIASVIALSPLQQDLGAGMPVKFAVPELNLLMAFVAFLVMPRRSGRGLVLGPVFGFVLLYLAICLLSSVQDFRGNSTIVSITQMVLYMVIAPTFIASFDEGLRGTKLGMQGLLFAGLILSAAEAVGGSNYVFGLHKNGIGASLSCAVIIAAELRFAERDPARQRLYMFALLGCAGGLVLSLSRGSWLATLVGLATVAALRRQFSILVKGAMIMVPVVALAWSYLPDKSKEFATGFEAERYNIKARLNSIDLAKAHFEKDPLLGVGVGLRKEFDATNLVWTVLAETGVVGLGSFLLIHVAIGRMAWRTRDVLSTEDARFSFVALGAALVLAKFMHGLVDHYWSRGSLMVAWSCIGAATRVYLQTGSASPRFGRPGRALGRSGRSDLNPASSNPAAALDGRGSA